MFRDAILLIGSNMGIPAENVQTALSLILAEGIEIEAKTDIYHTKPVEFASNNIFCNIALSIRTQKTPLSLLRCIKNIEKKMGRAADSKVIGHYTDRTIDIDIVSFGGLHFSSEELEIPHKKHLYEREFSAKLLNELRNT